MNWLKSIAIGLILAPFVVHAYAGRVITTQPLVVIMEQSESFSGLAGSEVTMTAKAGMLPMDIGRFKVLSYTSGAAELSPISVSTPPSRGMNVTLDVVKAPANQQPSSDGRLTGEVVAVDGETVTIALPEATPVADGSRVDLYYQMSSGSEIDVGQWKVTRSSGQTLWAAAVEKIGNPTVGLVAKIQPLSEQPQARLEDDLTRLVEKREPGIYPDDSLEALENFGKTFEQKSADHRKMAKAHATSGDRYYDWGDYEKAFEEYSRAAEMGHPGAQNRLGFMYGKGQYVAEDPVTALKWYQEAARQDHAGAIYNYATVTAMGHGTPKDLNKAHDLFLRSANMGNAEAQYSLGVFYYQGFLGDKDFAKARHWFEKASTQDVKEAIYALGVMHEKGEGGAKNKQEAMRYYTRAAGLGHAGAKQALEK